MLITFRKFDPPRDFIKTHGFKCQVRESKIFCGYGKRKPMDQIKIIVKTFDAPGSLFSPKGPLEIKRAIEMTQILLSLIIPT